MRSLNNFDLIARDAVTISRNYQAFERAGPMIFHSSGHLRGRFTRPDNDCAAGRRHRKKRCQTFRWISGVYRNFHQMFEQRSWIQKHTVGATFSRDGLMPNSKKYRTTDDTRAADNSQSVRKRADRISSSSIFPSTSILRHS